MAVISKWKGSAVACCVFFETPELMAVLKHGERMNTCESPAGKKNIKIAMTIWRLFRVGLGSRVSQGCLYRVVALAISNE